MTFPEGTDLTANVVNNNNNNNNIALRNVSVVDDTQDAMVSSVSLIGTGEEMRIQLKEVDASRPIGAAGALFVDLGQALHASWVAGGSQGVDVMPIDDSTMVFVDGPNPELSGIVFPASQLATLDVRFEPYVKVGGERLFPMVYRVDAELSVLHNGAFEAVGGQQFLFKTMSYTQKEGPGGAR